MLDDFVRRPKPGNDARPRPDISAVRPQPVPPMAVQGTVPAPTPGLERKLPEPAASPVRAGFPPTPLEQLITKAKQDGPVQLSPTRNPLVFAKRWWQRRTKLQKIIFSIVLVALLAAGSGAVYAFAMSKEPAPAPVQPAAKVIPKPAAPTTVAAFLTGLPVAPAVNQRPVTGVMIENSLDARPQSGLKDAGVVFEAIAEGGITRFLALYQDTQPDYVGPVRSARPYYVQWAQGFDAGYAHVGGSPQALADIKANGVKDLDQFYNSAFYQRITSRYAPHNVYTSLAQLTQLQTEKGYTSSTYSGFARKAEAASKTPTARSIDLDVSSTAFQAHYDYTAACNCYARSEGGAPHTDERTAAQLSPKVVVAMVMQYGLEADDHHSRYNVIGSGEVSIFQDGVVTKGTWSKVDAKSQIVFTDANKQPIKLNPGQTWLTALSSPTEITYQ